MKRFDRVTCPECGRPDVAVSWANYRGHYGQHQYQGFYGLYQHHESMRPTSPWCVSAGRSYRG